MIKKSNLRHLLLTLSWLFLNQILLAQNRLIQNPEEMDHSQLSVDTSISKMDLLEVNRYKLSQSLMPIISKFDYTEEPISASLQSVLQGVITNTDYTNTISVSLSKKVPTAYIYTTKYRLQNNQIYQIKNIKITLEEIKDNLQARPHGSRSYVSNSRLSTGDWHKISVSQSGIYKLDFSFLQNQMGLTGSIPSSQIQIYGNGGQMLNWNNAVIPSDDILELPLEIHDGGDGTFGTGDYILFYASGPDSEIWNKNGNFFSHKKNIFEDRSYYFVTWNGVAGKRITSQNLSSFATSSSKYYKHIYREQDSTIIEKVGGVWLGDEMNSTLSYKTFTYPVSNAITGEFTKLYSNLAYRGEQSSAKINYSTNGQTLAIRTFSRYYIDYYYPPFTNEINLDSTLSNVNTNVRFDFYPNGYIDKAFIDYFDLTIPCSLNAALSGQYIIRNPEVTANNQNVKWDFDGILSKSIWNVSDLHDVSSLSIDNSSGHSSFIAPVDSDFRYIVFDPNSDPWIPEYKEKVNNQNLHAHTAVQLTIVCPDEFIDKANDLATYRNSKGVSTRVVRLKDIYNEFSSGSQDIVAIRDYMKMLYDKSGTTDGPENLLLFGDASFDYKNRIANNTNFVPTYETENIVRINSFNTDDLFGFLDDNENPLTISPASLDLGVGRIVCKTNTEAQTVINKIKTYESPMSFGNWKLKTVFTSDNADQGSPAHTRDADYLSNNLERHDSMFNQVKIFGDAFPLVSTPGGSRLPDMNSNINAAVNQGALLLNYNGHGGETGLAQEGIVTFTDIQSWRNKNNLPIFITATCDFSKFDFPELTSAGERILIDNENGGIALLTTTQAVFASSNRTMNNQFLLRTFGYDSVTSTNLGEGWRMSKNDYYNGPSINWGETYNFQKFCLLGDPSMYPAVPTRHIIIDSITQLSNDRLTDTLRSRGRYKMHGHVVDENGNLISDYNGLIYPSIYDKTQEFSTVYQYPTTPIITYKNRSSIIYKGKSQATNGYFNCSFILPKDIQYQYGKGKISSYGYNDVFDLSGDNFRYTIGGEDTSIGEDNEGPEIQAYLNDENFVNGGITSANPVLILKLKDISGINTTGSSIGHDLLAILDDNQNDPYVLNNYYESQLNDYTSGTVTYPFYKLAPGIHHLDIKVWDGNNNSNTVHLDFQIVSQENLELNQVYNYPNPFATNTNFMFEHNFPNENLHIMIKIYTVSGKLVKTITRDMYSIGTRIADLEWDGKDDFGDNIANGTYYYRLEVQTPSGKSAKKYEKLYIIK